MTTEQIFAIRDLSYLYKLWNDKTITDAERIDVASMIDRFEKWNLEKAKAAYNVNEVKDIINEKYESIL
jgi:hypothetical protein